MKIIALTDFSKTADKAVEYAKIIAQKNNDEIILFHNINAFLSEYAASQIFDADYQWQAAANNELIDTIIEEKTVVIFCCLSSCELDNRVDLRSTSLRCLLS